jgi:hypothetical protein
VLLEGETGIEFKGSFAEFKQFIGASQTSTTEFKNN